MSLLAAFRDVFFPPTPEQRRRDEYEAAADRGRAHNAAAKAAGCKCGRPATKVRRVFGTVGGVPCEIWSCDEHVNVNGWTRSGEDGAYVPGGDYTEADLRWMSEPSDA